METVFLLIETEVGQLESVLDRIRPIPGVVEIQAVTGPFDLIVKVQATHLNQALDTVVHKIRGCRGSSRPRPSSRSWPASPNGEPWRTARRPRGRAVLRDVKVFGRDPGWPSLRRPTSAVPAPGRTVRARSLRRPRGGRQPADD
ncbi:protein containing Transcription regulator, AsnC-type [mine drainage metagenome]|uniref:Protein containing Transcription regulator, AsnC-type n=1 Tax=mine drainage metagenome TaxID=410659 RepID=T1CKB0_9ZZZZ